MDRLKRAFTLVEILVVLAILATMVVVPSIAYSNVSRNARDTRRMQDIDKVSAALQQYRSQVGTYPLAANYDGLAEFLIPSYLSQLPEDPQGANAPDGGYKYEPAVDGTSFNLYAVLEKMEGENPDIYLNTHAGSRTVTGAPPTPTDTP